MSKELPKINWIENDPSKYNQFFDGSVFLVAVLVRNNKTGGTKWEFDCVEVKVDCDGSSLYYKNGDIYDSWSWDDFEYFSLLEGDMPYFQYEPTTIGEHE